MYECFLRLEKIPKFLFLAEGFHRLDTIFCKNTMGQWAFDKLENWYLDKNPRLCTFMLLQCHRHHKLKSDIITERLLAGGEDLTMTIWTALIYRNSMIEELLWSLLENQRTTFHQQWSLDVSNILLKIMKPTGMDLWHKTAFDQTCRTVDYGKILMHILKYRWCVLLSSTLVHCIIFFNWLMHYS